MLPLPTLPTAPLSDGLSSSTLLMPSDTEAFSVDRPVPGEVEVVLSRQLAVELVVRHRVVRAGETRDRAVVTPGERRGRRPTASARRCGTGAATAGSASGRPTVETDAVKRVGEPVRIRIEVDTGAGCVIRSTRYVPVRLKDRLPKRPISRPGIADVDVDSRKSRSDPMLMLRSCTKPLPTQSWPFGLRLMRAQAAGSLLRVARRPGVAAPGTS